ncbi:DsbA family protein [Aeromonas schubertii]|uniref:DsbA family protein n=1 Tax=Aeromonas schubertii TaxID=652 RepID=UPI001CC6FB22|nr:DsbA family protein [Aeromonas schubertii]MBZ6072270.1 DsbA family protein [Aeromonas schubertii]
MIQDTLHYVYDPLCGWCYGAAPLLKVAATLPGLRLQLHGGGLWLEERRRPMGRALHDYVRPHDERIAALTGQSFGARYFDELLLDEQGVLDSEPPLRAILAVTALGGHPLTLLRRIQECHYRDGLRVGQFSLLASLAAEQGIESGAFRAAFDAAPLVEHLRDSQWWLRRIGGQGYPTLALQQGERLERIQIAGMLGHPEALLEWLVVERKKRPRHE